MNYDVALIEKEACFGLTKSEILDLFDILSSSEGYPLELEARCHECAAMGFITPEAAEVLDYDYETSGFHDFIANILDDMENESDNYQYEYKGITVFFKQKYYHDKRNV